MKPLVVSVFDRTTTMLKPWAEAGYPCMAVDLQHPRGLTEAGVGGMLIHIENELRRLKLPRERAALSIARITYSKALSEFANKTPKAPDAR